MFLKGLEHKHISQKHETYNTNISHYWFMYFVLQFLHSFQQKVKQ